MFLASTRKYLQKYFRKPVRTRSFRKMAGELARELRFSNASEFIQVLLDEGIVHPSRLEARNGKSLSLYCSRLISDLNVYELALALSPSGYLCNLSSIYYHSLTNQVPSIAYICNETISPRDQGTRKTLSGEIIRTAFIKPHRFTNNIFDAKSGSVVIIDRERRTGHGVISIRKRRGHFPKGASLTCLERALIDAIVAPQHNGGISSVTAYFRAARSRLRVGRLLEIYEVLQLTYPFAQSIGFFLERAGMQKRAAEVRSAYPPRQHFFVDHNAKATWKYDERWMVSYPHGLF